MPGKEETREGARSTWAHVNFEGCITVGSLNDKRVLCGDPRRQGVCHPHPKHSIGISQVFMVTGTHSRVPEKLGTGNLIVGLLQVAHNGRRVLGTKEM